MCGDDAQLRAEVEALLLNDAEHTDVFGENNLGVCHANGMQTDMHDPSDASERSDHGQFLPGMRIAERYRIVSRLGHGGMGDVYRADDLKLGYPVALKLLAGDVDARMLDWLLNEVRLARNIAHPNVCRVYDIGEADGLHFLTMEYIDGEDLRSLLRRIGRLPGDKGIDIARQICLGLASAHEKNVLHRDLKPSNVMVDGRGQVRITDFGIARLATDSTPEREILGTPGYMAPEQLVRGETTRASDIYALGLVLFELFTGRPVHENRSVADLLASPKSSCFPTLSTIVNDIDSAWSASC